MFIIAPRINKISVIGVSNDIEYIVSHLGINPVRGGIPLKDSNMIGSKSCRAGDIIFILLNCLLLICLSVFIMINRGIVIKQYRA
jgi:hypothetical protein